MDLGPTDASVLCTKVQNKTILIKKSGAIKFIAAICKYERVLERVWKLWSHKMFQSYSVLVNTFDTLT